MTELVIIQKEIDTELENPQILQSLIQTTFKGLSVENLRKALFEGMSRGFEFKDFLSKNVYAIPYGSSYSLVSSVDYSRKIGMKSGVCGVSAPKYSEDEKGNILTCEITVKRKFVDYIGEYTSLVYFKEYNSGRNLWATKPRTMIAKVAEMHALRKACPEELSQVYIEEENDKEQNILIDDEEKKKAERVEWGEKIMSCENIECLQNIWSEMPAWLKKEEETIKLKDEIKKSYADKKI